MVSEEEIKNIIIEGYRNILKREPDSDGLANYINEIKKGLSIEGFHNALRTSEEYKQRFSTINISPMDTYSAHSNSDTNITYCMMGTNRLHEIKSYIETTLPYIDRFIFIDGGSTDGTVDFLKSISEKNDNKLEVYIHEWQDKFSAQRNNYLKHFTEKQNNGWILVSDTDEHYPIDTLSSLKQAIRIAESEGYNGIKFQVIDIEVDSDDRNKILSRNKGQYWKALLYRYFPNIHYEGEPHESLVGYPIRWKDTSLTYEHYRSERKIYERATENFFISNSNRYSPKWAEFRFLCTKNNILKFSEFFKLYKEGALPIEIENWIYDNRKGIGNSGDSEVREMAKLYFEILHPEKRQIQQ